MQKISGQIQRKWMLWLIVLFVPLLYIVLALAHLAHNYGDLDVHPIFFDFENSTADEIIEKWELKGISELCCKHSLRVSEQQAKSGQNSLKFEIRKSDPLVKKSNRSELRVQAAKFGVTYNYQFSTYIPLNWQNDSIHTTIAQWHGVPDRILFETGRTPPLFLDIKDGKIGIGSFWDTKRMTKFAYFNENPEGKREVWISDLEKGVWADWQFQVRWSIHDDGLIIIYKDGEKLATIKGPNTYNDSMAPFFKFGLYTPQWNVGMGREHIKSRTVYFDNVSISLMSNEQIQNISEH